MNLFTQFHQRAVHQNRVEKLAQAAAACLPAEGRVLDIGCGDGQLAQRLANRFPGLIFEGVNVRPRKHTAIKVHTYDGKRLPWEDQRFDAALLIDVLHHTDRPAELLAEAARVAKEVVLKDHIRQGWWSVCRLRFMDWVGNAAHGVYLPYHYLSRNEWRELFGVTNLQDGTWNENLKLYPGIFDRLFGGSLHFLTKLQAGHQGNHHE